ncbi:MAG: MBL fold metallo-hydrolase [Bacteroidales bacterium]|nr:MBL fold metallo-hydrolase [Bacteroidales bacterium]
MTKLTFLGTGTSQGVPIIGCQCAVCKSADPKDKRLRAAALVEHDGLTILIDAGPDFRAQMLAADVRHLDAILLTHAHKDHTGGLDDVRSFNYIDKKAVEIYCEAPVLKSLRNDYAYAFEEHKYPGSPEWRVHLIDDRPFRVASSAQSGELEWVHDKGYFYRLPDGSLVPPDNAVTEAPHDAPNVIPIRGFHGQMPILGFRIGHIAYLTDFSSIPDSEFPKLRDLEHLTLNTVSYKPHHSHFSLEEALALAERIGARHTWLTHLSHTFPPYAQFCRELPPQVQPAWDGLTIHD